jgi:hypothetical protein
LQAADADAPAIVWLESKWRLADRAATAALVAATGDAGDGSQRSAREAGFLALARRVLHPPPVDTAAASATSSTSTAPGAPIDALQALRSAGFVSIERAGTAGRDNLSDLGGPGAAAVLVVGGDAKNPAPALVGSFASEFVAAGAELVVTQLDRDATNLTTGGALLAPVRTDSALSGLVSSVDDIAVSEGRIALVLAVSGFDAGRVGHYGYGPDASAPLPGL